LKYFLDTNVIIDMLKGKYSCMLNHFENTFSTDIYVPSIVVAELEYGAAHSANYEKNKSLYEKFISNFSIIPFDRKCCQPYGQIRQTLNSTGNPISGNDMLIAATVVANNGILVTHNVGEFSRVKGLSIEDWTEE
jgi:Predicted nucleic acid-binding protein, contains PIN domain